MTGITFEVKGNKLHIVADLSGKGTPSASGKTLVLASTRGNQSLLVDGKQVSVGVNVYTAAKD